MLQISDAMEFEKGKYHNIVTSGILLAVSKRFDAFIKVILIQQ